ncbi:MAG: DUF3365 domain-containing protein [Trichloromonas sp.]|jgi:PAS domain S-box-containing protein|nr:DUF3365 domain-containing protein [Trichloromonas sp.]
MTETSRDTETTPPEAQATGGGQFADSFVLVVVCWSLLICLLAGWDYYQARQSALNNARTAARHSYAKDLTFRKWATGHGGVYAPVSPANPPNNNLAHVPERDIPTPSGRPLTLINPATMLRQIHELADDTFGTRAHITSLRPIRPGNAPNPWEAATLAAFERGGTERSALETLNGETSLRLMRPILADTGCLKCHAAQGCRMGDIRGGISVAIPWAPYRTELRSYLLLHIVGYGGLWSLGLLGIGVTRLRLRDYLDERHRAEVRLRHSRGLMQDIIEHDPNAIAVLDRRFHYRYVSNRFLNDYKITRQDIIGKSHYEIFPEIPDHGREVHRRALAGEVHGAEDEPFERAGGRVDYVRWQCRPWHESDDSIGGIVLYTEVVTPPRKRKSPSNRKPGNWKSAAVSWNASTTPSPTT